MIRSSNPLAEPPVYDIIPPLSTWLIKADAISVDAVASEWIDEFTIKVTSATVEYRPSKVTVQYDGPDVNLKFRWGKQIEPFGPIVSTDLNWYTSPRFINRGDPNTWDATQETLTVDDDWHEWDLSSIVPAGAVAVLIRITICCPNQNAAVQFRKKGNVNLLNVAQILQQVEDVYYNTDVICPVDTGRKLEYYISSVVWSAITVCIKGWFT
jgi:hypothetical protein